MAKSSEIVGSWQKGEPRAELGISLPELGVLRGEGRPRGLADARQAALGRPRAHSTSDVHPTHPSNRQNPDRLTITTLAGTAATLTRSPASWAMSAVLLHLTRSPQEASGVDPRPNALHDAGDVRTTSLRPGLGALAVPTTIHHPCRPIMHARYPSTHPLPYA